MSDLQKFFDSCILLVLQVCAYPAHWVIQAGLIAFSLEGEGWTLLLLAQKPSCSTQRPIKRRWYQQMQRHGQGKLSRREETWLVPWVVKSTSLFSTLGNLHKISQNYLDEFVRSLGFLQSSLEKRGKWVYNNCDSIFTSKLL